MKVKVTRKIAGETPVPIHTEFIKLEALLKLCNAVGSGGMAKNEILLGEVQVNGEVCTMRGKKLYPGDKVTYGGNVYAVTGDAAE